MENSNASIQYVKTLFGDIAHLFTMGNHAEKYVFKFFNYRNRTKEIVNEYIVSRLAELLNLPVPATKIVFVTDEVRNQLPHKIKKHIHAEGYHIAVPFIEHCQTYSEMEYPPTKELLHNHNQLSGMIAFDLWINNTDRSRNNILFQAKSSGYSFHMIDHGRCFPGGYTWTPETLKQQVQHRTDMPVYKWALSLLSSVADMEQYAQRISQLHVVDFEAIVLELPQNWLVTEDEKQQLVQFLVRQQREIQQLARSFTEKYKYLMNS